MILSIWQLFIGIDMFYELDWRIVEEKVLCAFGYKLQILISSYLSFTEDSPPRIRIHREGGYYTTGTSGELLVYPGAIIHIDCLYHRNLGNPEWTLGNRYEYIQGRRVTRKPYPTGK